MAYTALYREWRPKTFGEVVGQSHVTITLRNQVKAQRIAHAYLLCGTRGTGKTSTAKILSKAVNCLNPKDGEPCNECEMCKKINSGTAIDVVEMDAASHRGIDKMRDIIDEVQYPPREAKYKVYIIDEVHMLTLEAVNAFLKTLEEPPKRVIFILATTDPQKLPVTILSRCQRFDFKRIKSEDIYGRLRKIVDEEGVFADDESLNLIARISDGAMRDALSVLDQCISASGGKVDYNQVVNILGLVTNENLLKITDAVIEKDVEKSLNIIDEIVLSGKDIHNFIKELMVHLRNLMIVKVSKNPGDILDMSSENMELLKVQSQKIRIEEIMRDIRILQESEENSKWSKQARIFLELAVIKMCKIEYDTSKEVILSRLNKLEKVIKQGAVPVENLENKVSMESTAAIKTIHDNIENKKPKDSEKSKDSEKPVENEDDTASDSKLTLDMVKKSWKDIMEIFKSRRMMVIYACLITGEPTACSGGVIDIRFPKDYAFSKKRLEKEECRKEVEEIFSKSFKEKVKLRYTVDSPDEGKNKTKTPEEMLKETFGENVVEIIDD